MISFDEWPEVMTAKDIQEIIGANREEIQSWFRRLDFPMIVPGKHRFIRVGKHAFRNRINKMEVRP